MSMGKLPKNLTQNFIDVLSKNVVTSIDNSMMQGKTFKISSKYDSYNEDDLPKEIQDTMNKQVGKIEEEMLKQLALLNAH